MPALVSQDSGYSQLNNAALMNAVYLAWFQRALKPEIYRCRVWIVYGLAATTVVPEPLLIMENAHIFSDFPVGTITTEDKEDPTLKRKQIALDLLEKHAGTVAVMAELLDAQYVGRCSTYWMNYTDELPWHTHENKEDLIWDLIDAYGEKARVAHVRPEKFSG